MSDDTISRNRTARMHESVRQHHVLVDESRLYARDMSDNIFLRMQVARMREICRTALSRG